MGITTEEELNERAENLVRNDVRAYVSGLISNCFEDWDTGMKVLDVDESEFHSLMVRSHTTYTCPECDRVFDESADAEECCDSAFVDEDVEEMEVMEHWIVHKSLGRQLALVGESVVETSLGCIWGRTTTGQEIAADGIIRQLVSSSSSS